MNRPFSSYPPLALWAGMESTVNRVGDTFFDQLIRTGHAERCDDLDRIAALGIRTVRYPVLWERTAPDGLAHANWAWADERLGRLRELGITPIVGLVHHGSGPRHTSLVDPAFAEGLAQFAGAVAARYPWVASYTPVNEPLTTARFSGLYGHWYPHGRDNRPFNRTFALALLNQCRAVVLAMRAIREVNPAAQLIQTDDLGKTFSTSMLAYQAALENERRWLSWDLLCGRVTPDHALWSHLRRAEVGEADLLWFADNPCPPDIIGLNTYLSSERFLDEHLERYPPQSHGGNGQHAYADVLAARVRAAGIEGPGRLLREAWERYGRPLAITEAHNGCTREEQLRWLMDVWRAAQVARREGIDVRAVTAWAIFGAYDWHSLVTRVENVYEPGAFDVRGPQPRPTAIAALLRDLTAECEPNYAWLNAPGWWQRPERLSYGVAIEEVGQPSFGVGAPATPTNSTTANAAAGHRVTSVAADAVQRTSSALRPVVITGATGTLGRACARLCDLRGLPYRLLSRADMDIAEPSSVKAVLDALHPWAVVNAAGYVRVDAAEHEPDTCFRENADGPAVLAAACAERGVQLLTFSSDLVFDGQQSTPYVESNTVAPLNVYGRSKAAGEQRVLAALPSALVVRTSAFFGPWDQYNFITYGLHALDSGQSWLAADAVVSPTYVPDLVHAALDLLIDRAHGLWHLANDGAVTWIELARRVAALAGHDPHRVQLCSSETFGWTAPRPRYSVLGSEHGVLLPSVEDALTRYLREREVMCS